jgi:hypothetical protein
VLARIPDGSSVMTNTSVTLAETGIADAINDGGGRWESARNAMFALDFATQAQEMKAIGGRSELEVLRVRRRGRAPALTRRQSPGRMLLPTTTCLPVADLPWGRLAAGACYQA